MTQPIASRLSIVTTTHLIASAPSVWIFRKTLQSLRSRMDVQGCTHLVYYDAPAVLDARHEKYLENLNQLSVEFGLTIVVNPRSGLKANYLQGLRTISTPYMMFLEHDWIFKSRIDLPRLLDVFDKYGFVNIVRFNMHRNDSYTRWNHQSEPEDRIRELPLTRTSAWSNNPHIVRVDKWRRDWLPIVGERGDKGSFGLEEKLYWAYGKDIFVSTFAEAHAKWGAFLYGGFHAPPTIKHINGSLSENWLLEPFYKAGRLVKRLVRGHY